MKKTKMILGVMIASLLIGCNNSPESVNNQAGKPQNTAPIEGKESASHGLDTAPIEGGTVVPNTQISDVTKQENNIGENKAKEIALSKVPNGIIKEFSFDYDDNIPNYDVKVSDNTYEYDFEINAMDGSVVERDKENIERYDD